MITRGLLISMTVTQILPHLTDLLGWVRGQIFKFGKSVVNIVLRKFRMQTIDMKHINHVFCSKALVRLLVGQRVGQSQNSTFSEYGHVAYQIDGIDACSNMAANISKG